jgi:peptidyl-prolyl cis-trans isomerase SurA
VLTSLLLLCACGGEPQQVPVAEFPPPGPDTQVTAEPPVERPERVAVRHVLVTYTGATSAPFGSMRTRTEARNKFERALGRIRGGEAYNDVASKMSDDPSRARGGFLGSGEAGTWVPEFEDVAFTLAEGQVSGVVESPFGFHIIKREPLEEVHLRHLVVQFEGTWLSDVEAPAASRSKSDALLLATEALAALDTGTPFDQVAASFSDGPMGLRGADLGWFLRGELGPAFDAAAFALDVGQWSQVVETPYGLHVIERVE